MMEATSSPDDAKYALIGLFGCFFMVAVPIFFIVSLILAIVRKSKPWTIATVVIGVLGLGGVIAFVFFSAGSVSEAIKESQEPREFVSDSGGVALTGPGRWREQDLGHPDSDLEIGNLFAEEYLMVITEKKSDFEPDFTLDEFADIVSESMQGVLEESVATDFESVMVNGRNALRHQLNGTIDGVRVAYVNTFVDGVEHFHQVLAWTLEAQQEETLPKLEEVANSFRETAVRSEDTPSED